LKLTENENAAEVTNIQTEIQAMMQKTTGNRVECNRPEEELKARIKSTEKKIERIESSHENIDDIAQLLEDKKQNQAKQKSITEGLDQIQKTLATMRTERFDYVKKLRQTMMLRVRHKFAQLMELRSYTAEMHVDLANKTLELKVIPRDADIEGAVSNTKSLSGGERSYSTVSFLIALWSCVDHPFYFLDEYDVFSDEYNRHIMTMLLFNEAKKHPDKQYGFLTPLDFSNIQANEQITLHKLQDPDRKQ
jgi:chromosome segregation ATPase